MSSTAILRWMVAAWLAVGLTVACPSQVAFAKSCRKCRSDCKKAVKKCKKAAPKKLCKVPGVKGVCTMFKNVQCRGAGYYCNKVRCDTGTCPDKKKKKRKKHGRSIGDPHLYSFDGLRFDLQTAGEYVLARSQQADIEAQVRFTPAGDHVSRITMFALGHAGHTVAFERHGSLGVKTNIYVDGEKSRHPENDIVVAPDFVVHRAGRGAYLVAAGSVFALVHVRAHPIDVTITPDDSSAGSWLGLLGNANDDPDDDVRSRDGAVHSLGSLTPAAMHRAGSDSWRVRQDESILHYERGASTATHTDMSFPKTYVSLAGLSAETTERARQTCLGVGTSGQALRSCVYDVGFTGNPAYAEGYAGMAIEAPLAVVGQADPVALAPATLWTDRVAGAGDAVEVTWQGPGAVGDVVDLVKKGAPKSAPSIARGALSGGGATTVTLQAPGEPGDYMVRYLAASGVKVLATAPVSVTPLAVVLQCPASVAVGASFEVSWLGVEHATDAVAIVEQGGHDASKVLQQTRTDRLTSAKLRAPKAAGRYDVVYILRASDGRRVIARHPLIVTAP